MRYLVFSMAMFVAVMAASPALANDPRPNTAPPKVNPEAEKLNLRNPHVFHAGPGRPLEGSVYVAPSRVPKPDAKK
jgi:hypothetical protein